MVLGNECEDSLRALLAKNVNNSTTNKNNNLYRCYHIRVSFAFSWQNYSRNPNTAFFFANFLRKLFLWSLSVSG